MNKISYFLTLMILKVVHDTMQYFEANEMCSYSRQFPSLYGLGLSTPVIVPMPEFTVVASKHITVYTKRSF